MSQRKSRFSEFKPNNIGAEPAAVPQAKTPAPPTLAVASPPEPEEQGPEAIPALARKADLSSARLGGQFVRVRELSNKVMPFNTRLRPDQFDALEALRRRTGKAKLDLIEEALTLLFKKYAKQ